MSMTEGAMRSAVSIRTIAGWQKYGLGIGHLDWLDAALYHTEHTGDTAVILEDQCLVEFIKRDDGCIRITSYKPKEWQ